MNHFISKAMKRYNYLISEIDAAYHEAAFKLGLSDSVMKILYTISNSGGSCRLRDICVLSGISKQTINSALRKMEAEDIVYLEADGGKNKTVCFTEKGKTLAEQTVIRIIEAENGIFASWPGEDTETYLTLTERYLHDFREKSKSL